MLNCPDLDPAIANAAYMEFRASAGWLFDEASEEMSARGRYALAAIEDLRPATALEARVSAQAIASDAHAADCLRLAVEHRDDLAKVTRCRAQANAMMRQMDRALRTLTALRKERGAREAARPAFGGVEAGFDPARHAFEMPRDPEPEPVSAADPPPVSAPDPSRVSAADPSRVSAADPSPVSAPEPSRMSAAGPSRMSAAGPASRASDPVSPAALAKAEQFASGNRLLASRIRAAGGLTAKAIAGFRPSSLPDAATVEALVYGAGPVLTTLDRSNGTFG